VESQELQTQTLYKRLLGDAYGKLPEPLLRFHAICGGGAACGRMNVERNHGLVGRLIATLAGLPAAASEVDATVSVRSEAGYELWVRTFDRTRLVSKQWCEGGLLVESAGPMAFRFMVDVVGNGLQFRTVKCAFMGVRLPRLMAPSVTADVFGTSNGWWVSVELALPFIGRILAYQGEMSQD
jgi:hypothetical protein